MKCFYMCTVVSECVLDLKLFYYILGNMLYFKCVLFLNGQVRSLMCVYCVFVIWCVVCCSFSVAALCRAGCN